MLRRARKTKATPRKARSMLVPIATAPAFIPPKATDNSGAVAPVPLTPDVTADLGVGEFEVLEVRAVNVEADTAIVMRVVEEEGPGSTAPWLVASIGELKVPVILQRVSREEKRSSRTPAELRFLASYRRKYLSELGQTLRSIRYKPEVAEARTLVGAVIGLGVGGATTVNWGLGSPCSANVGCVFERGSGAGVS